MAYLPDIDPYNLDENDYELKFWVWARKIYENVEMLEDTGESSEEIRNYLQICADLREKFLSDGTTEIEDYWTGEVHFLFDKYHVIDPIY